MPHNIDHLQVLDPSDRVIARQTNQQVNQTTNQDTLGGENIRAFDALGLINFENFDPTGFATSNARANRAAALKQLNIQRKKLEFQKKTGLRDISQAREKGLKSAINNALQRGIFRSGIRIENEAEVSREADEAAGDLKTNIQFALDDLAARRQGLNAQKFGSPSDTGAPLSKAEAAFLANQAATFELNQPVAPTPFQDPTLQPQEPTSGVVQVDRPEAGPQ